MNKYTTQAIKVLLDIVSITLAFVASYFIRFDIVEAIRELEMVAPALPVYVLIFLVSFALFKSYTELWRYTGLTTLVSLIKATSISLLVFIFLNYFLLHVFMAAFDYTVEFIPCPLSGRRDARFWFGYIRAQKKLAEKKQYDRKRVLIYGAGDAGEQLIRNIQQDNSLNIKIVGLIDDNPKKLDAIIHNKRVLGCRTDIADLVKKYDIDAIYVALPTVSGNDIRELIRSFNFSKANSVEIMTIPSVSDLVEGRISVDVLRRMEIRDLLKRPQVTLDREPVQRLLKNKTVMVVGGGGSIGLELCTQIAKFEPNHLVILDSNEYAVYRSDQKLTAQFPKLKKSLLVGSACDDEYLQHVFQ